MFSILDLKHRSSEPAPTPPRVEEPVETPVEPPAEPVAEEFEFVLGRRQVASLSFVGMLVLTICVAAAYLAGKSTSVKPTAPAVPAAVVAPAPTPVVAKPEAAKPEPPMFIEPKVGEVYIQMGAVEKGIAVIFAEGLRRKGLPGVVASGPTPVVYRVLIGPLPDPAAFVRAKETVDKIGLSTFARKYPN